MTNFLDGPEIGEAPLDLEALFLVESPILSDLDLRAADVSVEARGPGDPLVLEVEPFRNVGEPHWGRPDGAYEVILSVRPTAQRLLLRPIQLLRLVYDLVIRNGLHVVESLLCCPP